MIEDSRRLPKLFFFRTNRNLKLGQICPSTLHKILFLTLSSFISLAVYIFEAIWLRNLIRVKFEKSVYEMFV